MEINHQENTGKSASGLLLELHHSNKVISTTCSHPKESLNSNRILSEIKPNLRCGIIHFHSYPPENGRSPKDPNNLPNASLPFATALLIMKRVISHPIARVLLVWSFQ